MPEPSNLDGDRPVIKCAALSKVFKDFWLRDRVRAVQEVDLDILAGEVFGLLGPNGSGKSTTIKMILGLLKPTSGRVFVYGQRPENVRTKRLIGYLPEESYLYPFLTARETLDYYARLFGIGGPQRRRRIDMLLEMVGLEAVQRRPVGEYSKGMQRRIGLAQALINDPKLLILDEPTTGLDPIGTRQIKDLIVELAERGKTVLLCSHLLADVEDVCDRVAIMFGGRVRERGSVGELLQDKGTTVLETDELDEATVTGIRELLTSRGHQLDRVDRSRRRLESLFLEIVERAQQEGASTSGAKSGGRIAQFLTDDEEPADGSSVIDRLTATEPSTSGESTSSETSAVSEKPSQRGDRAVIDELVSPETDEPDQGATEDEVTEPEPKKKNVDESVIDSLMDSDDRESD
ncbi:MAG: ABC transporter ATP-binding protein [Phycisphaeraceae bacterium]|nr:ABC transporter ATP-binding protein [Phycisphaeraceae bacterium]